MGDFGYHFHGANRDPEASVIVSGKKVFGHCVLQHQAGMVGFAKQLCRLAFNSQLQVRLIRHGQSVPAERGSCWCRSWAGDSRGLLADPSAWTALLCFLNVGAATSIFDVSKKRRWLRGNVGLLLEGRRNVGLLQEAEEMSGSVGGHIRLLMAGRGAGEKGKV